MHEGLTTERAELQNFGIGAVVLPRLQGNLLKRGFVLSVLRN